MARPEALLERWRNWYPMAPPVSHLLRGACPEVWLRIHSLPEGKRYATTPSEATEILFRHNQVATHVLGEGSSCAVILFSQCSSGAEGLNDLGLPPLHELGSVNALHWGEVSGDFTEPMCLFGALLTWNAGAIDPFLRAVADDKVLGLVVELEHGQVFGPYDGGADLFLASSAARDRAKGRYKAWLSDLAIGL